MKVLITGAQGFIGRNLVENLKLDPSLTLLSIDVDDAPELLERYVQEADFVFHLAGVNRPKDEGEFQAGNADLTARLCGLLTQAGRMTPLLLSSSIQAALDNPYGRSKRAAEDVVFTYGRSAGAPVYVFRLPNAFGKWSRPNYNSVVSTFCYNAAHGLPLRVDAPEKELTLVYIDDIVRGFTDALCGNMQADEDGFCRVEPQHTIALGALANSIEGFAQSRKDLTHRSDRADPLVQKLYATFLSYLDENDFAVRADMKFDARGYFAELIKSPHFGQISVSRTKPSITRGNHWHNTKVEKFIVVEGEALITFRKIDSSEVLEYPVSGEKIEIVDIPPGYTHAIKNTGDTDVLTIFWAGELFDPDHPDTFFLEV